MEPPTKPIPTVVVNVTARQTVNTRRSGSGCGTVFALACAVYFLATYWRITAVVVGLLLAVWAVWAVRRG